MKNFTQTPNELFDDTTLSWEEKGMLHTFFRNAPGWKTYVSEMTTRVSNGKFSTNNIFRSLSQKGFITKVGDEEQGRTDKGRFKNSEKYWTLSEKYRQSVSVNRFTDDGETAIKVEMLPIKEVNRELETDARLPIHSDRETVTDNPITATNNTKINNIKTNDTKEIIIKESRSGSEAPENNIVKTEIKTSQEADTKPIGSNEEEMITESELPSDYYENHVSPEYYDFMNGYGKDDLPIGFLEVEMTNGDSWSIRGMDMAINNQNQGQKESSPEDFTSPITIHPSARKEQPKSPKTTWSFKKGDKIDDIDFKTKLEHYLIRMDYKEKESKWKLDKLISALKTWIPNHAEINNWDKYLAKVLPSQGVKTLTQKREEKEILTQSVVYEYLVEKQISENIAKLVVQQYMEILENERLNKGDWEEMALDMARGENNSHLSDRNSFPPEVNTLPTKVQIDYSNLPSGLTVDEVHRMKGDWFEYLNGQRIKIDALAVQSVADELLPY